MKHDDWRAKLKIVRKQKKERVKEKKKHITRNAKIIAKEGTTHGANDASENEIRSDCILIEMSPGSTI